MVAKSKMEQTLAQVFSKRAQLHVSKTQPNHKPVTGVTFCDELQLAWSIPLVFQEQMSLD